MSSDAKVVRRLTDEAFIKGDLAVIDEIVGADFVSHDPPPGVPSTREGFKGIAAIVTTAFSDRALEFDETIATTDGRIVENWALTATHTGEAFGIPASGQSIRMRGMEIWRCENGKIVEHWGAVDMSDVADKAGS